MPKAMERRTSEGPLRAVKMAMYPELYTPKKGFKDKVKDFIHKGKPILHYQGGKTQNFMKQIHGNEYYKNKYRQESDAAYQKIRKDTDALNKAFFGRFTEKKSFVDKAKDLYDKMGPSSKFQHKKGVARIF
ncbi:MAG: hypothetical protein WC121_13960 [Candidatus Kapaibacterium sp.]|jgi:hypothetical protein